MCTQLLWNEHETYLNKNYSLFQQFREKYNFTVHIDVHTF